MIMKKEYLCTVKGLIGDTPEEIFGLAGMSKTDVLCDKEGILFAIWMKFQKLVEEYDCEPDWSYCEALKDIIGSEYRMEGCVMDMI